MKSIKVKLIAICTAVVLVVMIFSGSIMLRNVKANETQKSRETLMAYAKAIEELIVQGYEPSRFIDAFDSLDTLRRGAYDVQGCILDSLGQPIAPSEFRQMKFSNSAVVTALAGEEGFSVGMHAADLNGIDQEWLYYAIPTVKDGVNYVIFTRMNAKPMNDNLAKLTEIFVMMVLVALVLTGFLWFLFANTMTGPIITLTRSAKEMASGNLHNEISVHSNDEIGQLTESFNHMAKELNNTLSTMASEKNKSEAILHNMTDGVLAYDASGRIIHANNTSCELLQFDDIQTLPASEMLERLDFDAEEIYQLTPDQSKESSIAIGDRFLTACVTTYTNSTGVMDGFVIVLQDVTKMTKLDNMRKEFVANVSHELRTPLTSVKTYTETLLDGAVEDPETALRFLKVIDDETQRMSLLVTDLLELSRLDNRQPNAEIDVVDLIGLLRLCIRQNQILADKKSQRITFEAPGKPYFIEANASRVNQVISNIIGNSVKYSPEGTDIEVFTEETDRYYRVFIKDYGIGIPPEDQWRVFERFFRVDKARSRAMGGTGLGLAIAKEIMEEHGGRIIVTSKPGVGTTMVLRFNKYNGMA